MEGIIVPTTGFMLDDGFERKAIVPEKLSGYSKGSYEVVPGKRGYKKESCEVKFPLTSRTGSGACWIKKF